MINDNRLDLDRRQKYDGRRPDRSHRAGLPAGPVTAENTGMGWSKPLSARGSSSASGT